MQFNVARLLMGAVGTQETYIVDESFAPLEDTQTDRVKGQLRFLRTDVGVWVTGTLVAPARITCSRCLQESSVPVRFRMDDIYYPSIDVNTGARVPLPEEADGHCAIDRSHVLDITESIRQYTMVGLSMKPLCKPDCAGLCSRCGVNLNQATCSCDTQEMDARWLPLFSMASTIHGERTRS